MEEAKTFNAIPDLKITTNSCLTIFYNVLITASACLTVAIQIKQVAAPE
jgi:hypothetical protein